MSTRSNIVIKDEYGHLFFYRHSDGYPSVTAESLKTFLRWLIEGKIRDNVGQCSGWLILLGFNEYKDKAYGSTYPPGDVVGTYADWQVGAYEPTTGFHGDIVYAYVIDLEKKEIRCYRVVGRNLDILEDLPEPFAVITETNIDEEVKEPTKEEY